MEPKQLYIEGPTGDWNLFKIINEADSEQTRDLLSFMSFGTREFLENHFSSKEQTRSTLDSVDSLQAVWKRLVIDAVHFLRINDCRERAFLKDRSERWNGANKTTMSTERADKTASLNTYGIEELNKYFRQFTQFESTLYGADRYYRDHVQHPLRVWLIGLHILKSDGKNFRLSVGRKNVEVLEGTYADPSWRTFRQERDKRCKKSHDCKTCETNNICNEQDNYPDNKYPLQISTAELAAMWTIAALTHDLGYPLEKVERVNDQLEKMLSQFGNIGFRRSGFTFQSQHDHLVRILLRIVSSSIVQISKSETPTIRLWSTHVSPKYFAKYSKSWEMFEHGIVSSLILLRSLTFFLETDLSEERNAGFELEDEDARQFAIRAEILHTMAAHTTPKVYHLSANTLTFLLVICDELQEWGRPTMSDMRVGALTGSAKKVQVKKCKITEESSEIHCRIEYEKQNNLRDQEEHARRVFKNWHERLRPAVYDTKRDMIFTWEIAFGKDSAWIFELNTSKEVFKQVKMTGPKEGDTASIVEYDLYTDAV